MASERYQQMFSRLQARNEGAFVPFVTLADPNIELSERIIECLLSNGADALELGLPFSDPVADGPVIQAANIRALANGAKMRACFELLARVRSRHSELPIGLLVYCNLVHAQGVEAFYQRCAEAGVDSVLIADLPLRERQFYQSAAQKHGVQSVFICPPDASSELRQRVAEASEGYVYLLSRAGVTGADTALHLPATEAIAELAAAKSAPPLLGFGISQPDHVKQAIKSGAAGAISGSAVVRIIAEHLDNPERLLEHLGEFVVRMKAATLIDHEAAD
ncbi:tryptophan synthase subunit alpha [Aliidiomarina celeris]|uniref:tryptophan synthase subunit alpha n=1 Tax=Aliidiomarina celeris TaxID=2249428 RepID=UPI000DEACE4A|nr:tryptophan synthase subunit alpha [Aliidiomarina celeris]